MNYRCLTCGFVQDFEPTSESVFLHHPWMVGKPINECPACHKYIDKGGRKEGKIIMPHFDKAGTIQPEKDIKKELEEMDIHFLEASEGKNTDSLKKKYKNKRLFGWTIDELEELHKKRK